MRFCQPCFDWVVQHPKAARRVAFFLALSLFFSFLGWISDPVVGAGFCKVYP